MQIKDLSVKAERLEEIRGGSAVTQVIANGPVATFSNTQVGGFGSTVLNGSPVTSTTLTSNTVNNSQVGHASDSYSFDFDLALQNVGITF